MGVFFFFKVAVSMVLRDNLFMLKNIIQHSMPIKKFRNFATDSHTPKSWRW